MKPYLKNTIFCLIITGSALWIAFNMYKVSQFEKAMDEDYFVSNQDVDSPLADIDSTLIGVDDLLTEIKILNPIIDFGNVSNDTIINATFSIVNIGNNPLVIYYVNPDCNCTSIKYSKKPIMPNDSTKIALTIDTKNKIGYNFFHSIIRTNTQPSSIHRISVKLLIED